MNACVVLFDFCGSEAMNMARRLLEIARHAFDQAIFEHHALADLFAQLMLAAEVIAIGALF